MKKVLDGYLLPEDELVSGGAIGADSMGQRYAKETGRNIYICYPNYLRLGRGATFARNKTIAENSDEVLAFYQNGRFQLGGTANTIDWCRKLNIPFQEFEEEV
jgi:hypothetical protein